jgi:hypothetical protein
LRGFESELDSRLVGGLSKVGQEVTDLLLGGVDDLTGGCLIDGVGDIVTKLLEAAAQLLEELVGRQLGLGVHELLPSGERRGSVPDRTAFTSGLSR